MKRFIASLTGMLAVLLLVPAISFASPNSHSTISGIVTQGGNPVSGATVTVACNGIKLKTTGTTVAGAYSITFGKVKNCPEGSTATVTATKGSQSGTSTGTLNNSIKKINVAIVNVSLVPELGTVVGIAAAVLGAGIFLVIRRRQLGAH